MPANCRYFLAADSFYHNRFGRRNEAKKRRNEKPAGKNALMNRNMQLFPMPGLWWRRDRVAIKGLPGREQILKRMWKLANAGAKDAVKLACYPEEQWDRLEDLDLDALTEFKRGANGVIELKFADRAKLLERLLDAADHSGEEQVDRFLRAMEEKGE